MQRSSCELFFWRRSWCGPARHCWSRLFGATEATWGATYSASWCRWTLPTSILPRSSGVLPRLLTDSQLVRPKKQKNSIKLNILTESFFFFSFLQFQIEHLAWQQVKALNYCDPTFPTHSPPAASWTSTCRTACVSSFSSWTTFPSRAARPPSEKGRQWRRRWKETGTWSSR